MKVDNQVTFEAGKSGNPNGRPPNTKKLKLVPLETKSVEALTADLEDPEKRGAAARYILDQLYGKASQSHDLGEAGDKIVNMILKVAAKAE